MRAIECENLKKEENGFVTDKKRIKVAKIKNGYVLGEKSIVFITKGTIEVYRYTRSLTEEEKKRLEEVLENQSKETIDQNKEELGVQGGQKIKMVDGEIYIDDMLVLVIKDEDVILYWVG